MPEWLERELSRGLAPVEAPETMRERVFPRPAAMPARRVSAFLIAATMVALSAGTVWLSGRQTESVRPVRWTATAHTDHSCLMCHTL